MCPAPCEKACVCGTFGQPVTIRDNELAIIEEAFARGDLGPCPPDKRSGKTVAVVGSGPAGLAAAYYLNRRGHTVTVLEQSPRPGGLLTYGIPAMKLEKEVVARRLALMEAEGVAFRTGVAVGKDLSPEELDRIYDGVVFACGAQAPRAVPWAEDGQPGFCYGLDYLTQQAVALEEGRESSLTARGKRVAVVGTGDTAGDCVAVALRQGCAGLTQLVRKPASRYGEGAFAGDAQGEASARFQGPIQRFSTQIKTLLRGEEGGLTGAVLDTPQGEEEIPLDLVIAASGFAGCQETALRARQAMPRPEKAFSAGDMVLGASLVVLAIADGRRAAGEADRFLMGYTNLI